MLLSKPVGLQAKSIVEAEHRLNIWTGAVRSGKTVGSVIKWLEFIARGPEGELLMAGKTERTLKRNILDLIGEMVGDDHVKVRQGAGEATIFGRRVYLAGANDERSETKIRGLTIAGAYGDELTTWSPNFFGMMLTRMSVKGAQFFGTTNPEGPRHWLKLNYLDLPDLDMGHWPFKLDDNPNLDPDVVAAIKQENVGVYYKRYVMGEWVQAEGAIYDNWNEKVHVVYRMPRIMRWMSTGVDYGRVNPFVALLLGLGEDGRVYVTSELRWDSKKQRMQKDDQQYSRDYQQWLATYPGYADGVVPEWTLVDPTARSFLVQLYKDGVSGVRDAENEVGDGIRTVARALGQDRLRIHASCTGLIEEFPAYAWDEKAAERGIDQPLKQNDHSLDALRYGLMGTRHIWEQTTLRDAEPVEEP